MFYKAHNFSKITTWNSAKCFRGQKKALAKIEEDGFNHYCYRS